MGIIVQKFGGTSVATPEGRNRCVHHIQKARAKGHQVIVVVSAMGRKGEPYATDTLLSLVGGKEAGLDKKTLDLLMSTGEIISTAVLAKRLAEEGIPHSVLTGGQAGIITNQVHTEADITGFHPKKLLTELQEGNVVVVAGFQGVTEEGNITTLGRGGSDTSATALGVAVEADFVDIFTDVDGIFTADPRIVKEAVSLQEVTYEEICNLAHMGAKVIHPRAVEMAMKKNIPIRVRSTFEDGEGTLITTRSLVDPEKAGERLITGITQTSAIAQIKVQTKENKEQLQVFKSMKENEISIDFINVYPEGVTFTVKQEDMMRAASLLTEKGFSPVTKDKCSKVSLVGANMAGVPGVLSKIVETLAKHDITILQSVDSHTTIWVLTEEKVMEQAVCALHEAFELNR